MYEAQVKAAAKAVAAQDEEFFDSTVGRASLAAATTQTLASLDDDIARIRKSAAVLFPDVPANAIEAAAQCKKLARLFEDWRNDPPSVTALVCVAAEHFGIPETDKNLQAALMVSLAANVPHANPYHSTHHFREVTASLARLAHLNNELAAEGRTGAVTLDTGNLAKALLAAAAHDLLHDGKGNSPAGPRSWTQYRLENRAIHAAEPFMALAGMAESDQEDVRTMIRTTDVTFRHVGHLSPHKHLRRLHAETFGAPAPLLRLAVPAGLEKLGTDTTLLVMAALLSDADLTPSAATDYAFGRQMTRLFSQEMPATVKDSDQTLAGFISFVADHELCSAAGKAGSKGVPDAICAEALARAGRDAERKPETPPAAPPANPGSPGR